MIKKAFALLLFIIALPLCSSSAPLGIYAPFKHKSEAEIARMTPAQRVDEWCYEQVNHRFDLDDNQGELIEKYIWRDGLAALPRIIEILDEYYPTRASCRSGNKGERFDAVLMLLDVLDHRVVRLRGTEEGRRAVDSLEGVVKRMRMAGYSQKDEVKWSKYERYDFTALNLGWIKGINDVDNSVKDTLWVRYKIQMSKEELLAFSNFLIARDPTYPSWSDAEHIKGDKINEAGNPIWVYVMKKPERFYEAYLEFKKTKQ